MNFIKVLLVLVLAVSIFNISYARKYALDYQEDAVMYNDGIDISKMLFGLDQPLTFCKLPVNLLSQEQHPNYIQYSNNQKNKKITNIPFTGKVESIEYSNFWIDNNIEDYVKGGEEQRCFKIGYNKIHNPKKTKSGKILKERYRKKDYCVSANLHINQDWSDELIKKMIDNGWRKASTSVEDRKIHLKKTKVTNLNLFFDTDIVTTKRADQLNPNDIKRNILDRVNDPFVLEDNKSKFVLMENEKQFAEISWVNKESLKINNWQDATTLSPYPPKALLFIYNKKNSKGAKPNCKSFLEGFSYSHDLSQVKYFNTWTGSYEEFIKIKSKYN